MSETDPTAADYQKAYNDWAAKYDIATAEWIDSSEEAWARVEKLDPNYVWTNHSTCGDEMVTNGAHLFKNSCCWDTFGWWISKTPWDGDGDTFITENTSAYLPCTICNPDGEEEDPDPDCPECEGDGYVHHYFD